MLLEWVRAVTHAQPSLRVFLAQSCKALHSLQSMALTSKEAFGVQEAVLCLSTVWWYFTVVVSHYPKLTVDPHGVCGVRHELQNIKRQSLWACTSLLVPSLHPKDGKVGAHLGWGSPRSGVTCHLSCWDYWPYLLIARALGKKKQLMRFLMT